MTGEPVARLVYEQWTDPVAAEMLADRPDLEVERLDLDRDPSAGWTTLVRAHGYQVATRTACARVPGGEQWLADRALIERCPDLLAVCSAGAGYDVIDVNACTQAGVIVCNNSGPGAEAVAEHALGLMLSLTKRIGLADRMLRRSGVGDRSVLQGCELRGKTLGVVGLGRIGTRLVELCVPFGMTVLAYDPYLDAADVGERGATKVDLDELLARSDIVQVTCPLTAETTGLFSASAFARMKSTAFFVTTARGEVHDEDALVDALTGGRIGGAGIDVFHDEPPAVDHPLLALETVVATPHTAGITVEAARAIAVATAEQWLAIFEGKVPPRLVNPAAWPRYQDRFESVFGSRPADLA
jgi:D-3-phosphoglycerate dehydrogenase / 2-oxoglutarate reductase